MNKKLNAKELLIVGVCLIILCGLVGNISPGLGGLMLVGGLICIIAAPFNIKKVALKKIILKRVSLVVAETGEI